AGAGAAGGGGGGAGARGRQGLRRDQPGTGRRWGAAGGVGAGRQLPRPAAAAVRRVSGAEPGLCPGRRGSLFRDPAAGRGAGPALAGMTAPGRLEVVRRSPVVIVDSAHNPAGMAVSVDAVTEAFGFGTLVAVLAVSADKDVAGMLEQLEPAVARLVVTRNSA